MKNARRTLLLNNYQHFIPLFSAIPYYDDEYIKEIFSGPGNTIRRGAVYNADYQSEYVSVANGIRTTIGVPDEYESSVYLLGSSTQYCYGAEDKHTIASFLQSFYNASDKKIRIENHGVQGAKIWNLALQILTIDFKPSDAVVIMIRRLDEDFAVNCIQHICNTLAKKHVKVTVSLAPNAFSIENPSEQERYFAKYSYDDLFLFYANEKKLDHPEQYTNTYSIPDLKKKLDHCGIHTIDLLPIFNRPHDMGEVFFDKGHWNYKGNRKIAECFFQALANVDFYSDNSPHPDAKKIIRKCMKAASSYSKKMVDRQEIQKYVVKNKEVKFEGASGIGAIVMNANPFTKGHLHLIQSALKKVEKLYIFVVETDRSYFRFEDRLHLIRLGTRHLDQKRIRIIPSGKFIISSFTFPDYFSKETKTVDVDPSLDAMIFCSIIAPQFSITDRFVGQEPTCQVTRQYNKILQKYLAIHGLRFHILPRIEKFSQPISASIVRKCIADSDKKKLKAIVPSSTYYFLVLNNYFQKNSKLQKTIARFCILCQKFFFTCTRKFS